MYIMQISPRLLLKQTCRSKRTDLAENCRLPFVAAVPVGLADATTRVRYSHSIALLLPKRELVPTILLRECSASRSHDVSPPPPRRLPLSRERNPRNRYTTYAPQSLTDVRKTEICK